MTQANISILMVHKKIRYVYDNMVKIDKILTSCGYHYKKGNNKLREHIINFGLERIKESLYTNGTQRDTQNTSNNDISIILNSIERSIRLADMLDLIYKKYNFVPIDYHNLADYIYYLYVDGKVYGEIPHLDKIPATFMFFPPTITDFLIYYENEDFINKNITFITKLILTVSFSHSMYAFTREDCCVSILGFVKNNKNDDPHAVKILNNIKHLFILYKSVINFSSKYKPRNEKFLNIKLPRNEYDYENIYSCNEASVDTELGEGSYGSASLATFGKKHFIVKNFFEDFDNLYSYIITFDLNGKHINKPISLGDNCLTYKYRDADLANYIDLFNKNIGKLINKQIIKGLIQRLAIAIYYCHINLISHSDIKPENILINSDGSLYLNDFDLAKKRIPQKYYNNVIAVPMYSPPELVKNISLVPYFHFTKYVDIDPFAVDIWSLGYVMIRLINIEHLFPLDLDLEYNKKILDYAKDFGWKSLIPADDDESDFLSFCMVEDFEKRPNIYEILKHPYIKTS